MAKKIKLPQMKLFLKKKTKKNNKILMYLLTPFILKNVKRLS